MTSRLAFLLMFLMWAPQVSHAQVNLDQPLNISRSDHVFLATNDPKVAYAMPVGLRRLSPVRFSDDGDRVVAHFDVGIPDSEFNRLGQLLPAASGLRLEVVRALEADLIPGSGTDLESRQRAIVTAAGDPRSLAGPIRYALSVKKVKNFKTQLKQLFGPRGADHIANLRIEFDSFALGAPYKAASVIPIFVGEIATAKLADHLVSAIIAPAAFAMVFDKTAACWQSPAPQTVCLRPH